MARLSIKLLGGFQVSLCGQPVTGGLSAKGRALLAYLALECDRTHDREALAEMLWPDQPNSTARTNLRQSLHRLRQYIDDPGASAHTILILSQEIQFNSSSDCWVDASEFSRLLDTANAHHQTELSVCEVCLRNLRHAAELYQGDLLAGFSLPDSPRFDWWLFAKVEEHHRQAIIMLDRLVIHFKHNGDYSVASKYAQRAIELEPWRERSHRMKMRTLAMGGNPGAAIRQYETCRQILAAEMGIEPSNKTKELMEQIRRGWVQSLSNLHDEYRLKEPLIV